MAVHNPLAGVSLAAARWSASHPWRAILAWVAFVAVSVGIAMAVPTVEADEDDYYMGEWGEATQMIEDAGLDNPDSEVVLITADGDLDAVRAEAAAAELTERMRATDGVDAVAEPQWSEDRSALLVSVQLARDQEDVTDLQAVTEDVAADHTDLRIGQAGDNSVDDAINDQVADDLSSAEATSVPITLILMLIAFGA